MRKRKGNLLAGALAALVGLIAAFAIHARPEGLRVPAWVAYAAALAFVLAGLVIVAIETRRARLYAWLVVGLLAAMFAPAAWLAFGPGARACTLSIGGFASPELMCRSIFGFGAIMLAFMLAVAIRAARVAKNAN